MRLRLREITTEEEQHHWDVPSSWIMNLFKEEDENAIKSESLFLAKEAFQLAATLYRNEEDIFFRAKLQGKLSTSCVRCLEAGSFDVDVSFSGVYSQGESQDTEEAEDPGIFFYNGEEIDFSVAVRENIILSIPTHPLCQDKCKGLCPSCGENLNFKTCQCEEKEIDPRWKVLQLLQQSKKD